MAETRPAKCPTQDDIAPLPRYAQVAFAARCARRVLPLYSSVLGGAPSKWIAEVVHAVETAERIAAAGSQYVPDEEAALAAYESAKSAAQARGGDPAGFAAAAAAAAACCAIRNGCAGADTVLAVTFADMAASNFAHVARIAHATESVRTAMQRDLRLLSISTRQKNWGMRTPVPVEFFGALWPEGKPTKWPDLGLRE